MSVTIVTKHISELPATPTVDAADYMPMVHAASGATSKMTMAQLTAAVAALIPPPSGGAKVLFANTVGTTYYMAGGTILSTTIPANAFKDGDVLDLCGWIYSNNYDPSNYYRFDLTIGGNVLYSYGTRTGTDAFLTMRAVYKASTKEFIVSAPGGGYFTFDATISNAVTYVCTMVGSPGYASYARSIALSQIPS